MYILLTWVEDLGVWNLNSLGKWMYVYILIWIIFKSFMFDMPFWRLCALPTLMQKYWTLKYPDESCSCANKWQRPSKLPLKSFIKSCFHFVIKVHWGTRIIVKHVGSAQPAFLHCPATTSCFPESGEENLRLSVVFLLRKLPYMNQNWGFLYQAPILLELPLS